MKKILKNRTICLAAAAFALAGSLTVGSALAYFTAFDTAAGEKEIDLGFTVTIPEEDVVDGKKEIVLKNTGDFDCYVRLKALTGDKYKANLQYSGDEKWTPGVEEFYYYSDIVPAGGETSQIDVSFAFPTEEPDDFNVIIIQECTPVLYDEDGNPYADWSVKADISQSQMAQTPEQ